MSDFTGKTVVYQMRRAVVLNQRFDTTHNLSSLKLQYENGNTGYAPAGLVKVVEDETALATTTVRDVETVVMMTVDEARSTVRQINDQLNTARTLLLDLYERRGWEALGYSSWRECATAEFGDSKTHLYRQLEAARIEREISTIVENDNHFSPIGEIPESHLRPLTKLDTPREAAEIYVQAVATAPNGKVTAAYVQAVVDDMRGNGRHKPKSNYAAEEATPDPRDQCQTPPYAVDPLLPYLPDTDCVIWEPAAGEGLLAEALFDCGYRKVTVSDAITGQNFFESEPDAWDILITNPPFSLKYKWLERCYALGKPFALLLPVETLGAASAQVLFREYGIDVIFMSPRIDFKMPNEGWNGSGAQFPSAWFCWRLLDMPQMTFVDISVAKRAFVEALR